MKFEMKIEFNDTHTLEKLNNGVYFVKVFINNTYNETHRLIITK